MNGQKFVIGNISNLNGNNFFHRNQLYKSTGMNLKCDLYVSACLYWQLNKYRKSKTVKIRTEQKANKQNKNNEHTRNTYLSHENHIVCGKSKAVCTCFLNCITHCFNAFLFLSCIKCRSLFQLYKYST